MDRKGVKAAWSTRWPSTILSTGFVWIIQRGRCGRGWVIRSLARIGITWSVRRVDSEFVSCSTFHWIGQIDHRLVSASLQLANRHCLAGYWKFNTSLLEIRDFREWLGKLIQRALVGAITGNRWWISLKYRIRDFAIEYGRRHNLDWAKKVKSLEDRLSFKLW